MFTYFENRIPIRTASLGCGSLSSSSNYMMKEKEAITSGGGGGGGGLEDGKDILRRLATNTSLPERVITEVVFVRAKYSEI